MQCATQGLGEDFDLGEKDLSENFLLDIFLGVDSKIPEWDATGITIKQVRLALLDPTLTSQENWVA